MYIGLFKEPVVAVEPDKSVFVVIDFSSPCYLRHLMSLHLQFFTEVMNRFKQTHLVPQIKHKILLAMCYGHLKNIDPSKSLH